jgi:transcriptional regulator with XRE-family HTH domain
MSDTQELNDRIVGAHIRRLRRALDMRQVDLGKRMAELGFTHWSQSSITKIENGIQPLRLVEAIGLASILGCEVEDLAGRVDGVVTPHAHEILAQVTAYLLALAESGNAGAQRLLSPYEPPDNGSAALASGSQEAVDR